MHFRRENTISKLHLCISNDVCINSPVLGTLIRVQQNAIKKEDDILGDGFPCQVACGENISAILLRNGKVRISFQHALT